MYRTRREEEEAIWTEGRRRSRLYTCLCDGTISYLGSRYEIHPTVKTRGAFQVSSIGVQN